MKTPREVLLARHQTADAKLDEIRRAVVADLKPRPAPEPEISFALKFWRELIWPCRRTWAGVATAWLVIAGFNLSNGGEATVAKSPTTPGEMRLALQEQQQMLAEIIGSGLSASVAEPPRRSAPKPRSERSMNLKTC